MKATQDEVTARLAGIIRRLRKAAGLTQKELAYRSGLHVSEISALERGLRASPRVTTIKRLCGALRVEPGAFFEGIRWVPARPGEPRSNGYYELAPLKEDDE